MISMIRTDFDFRRTVTTLVFCGAGMAILPVVVWMVWLLRDNAPFVFKLAEELLGILAIVVIGLSFTVAMRQINGAFGIASFSASGGDELTPEKSA